MPDQKFIYIFYQLQTFCARQKDNLHSVKLVFVPTQKVFEEALNAVKFLGWSKFFVPDQRFIYILWQSQTFCARQKDDLHSVKFVFVPAQKFLMRH